MKEFRSFDDLKAAGYPFPHACVMAPMTWRICLQGFVAAGEWLTITPGEEIKAIGGLRIWPNLAVPEGVVVPVWLRLDGSQTFNPKEAGR